MLWAGSGKMWSKLDSPKPPTPSRSIRRLRERYWRNEKWVRGPEARRERSRENKREAVQTILEPSAVQRLCESFRSGGKTIGFVPTMGFLHEGHLSLMRTARAENAVLVVIIFVNPTPFGRGEGFVRYP